MKKILAVLSILLLANVVQAQKLINTKWYEYYLGGTKGFFIKTHTIEQEKLIENQTGSGGAFDNKPTDISIEKFITTGADERIINKYDDTTFMVIVFKNIDTEKAKVCLNTEMFKSIEAATAYLPNEEEYTTWYTEAGFKKENSKPVIPNMTKGDMLAFSNFMIEKLKETSKKLDAEKLEANEKDFRLAMSSIAVPFLYAESKGYNVYKSLTIFEAGIKKFRKDPAVIKTFKDAGFSGILSNK